MKGSGKDALRSASFTPSLDHSCAEELSGGKREVKEAVRREKSGMKPERRWRRLCKEGKILEFRRKERGRVDNRKARKEGSEGVRREYKGRIGIEIR